MSFNLDQLLYKTQNDCILIHCMIISISLQTTFFLIKCNSLRNVVAYIKLWIALLILIILIVSSIFEEIKGSLVIM